MPKHQKALEAQDRLKELRARAASPPDPVHEPPPLPQPAPAALLPPANEPPPAAPPPAILPTEDAATLKHRLQTLDGVLKKERSAAELALATERQRVAELEARLAEVSTPPPAPLVPTDVFGAEFVTEEGEDKLKQMLAGIDKVIATKVEARVAPLQQKLDAYERRDTERNQTEGQRKVTEFNVALSAAVPGWETWAVGDSCDPRFAEWLLQRVPGSRMTRQQLLLDAQKHLNVTAVVEVLQEFLRSLGVPTPPPTTRVLPTGLPSGDRPPPVQPEFTRAQIEQFRMDLTQGKYRGRGKEAAEMHRRIMAAFRSGRIA